MTLGTAANSSIRNVIASDAFGGASSARKIAAPTPKGTAIINATADVTIVPKINGRAPKSPATGSHSVLTRNARPNFSREAPDLLHNSQTSSAVIARIATAQTSTTTCP